MSIPGLESGDDPTGTTFATQFQREAPQIEARKLQLMDVARDFAQDPVTIPAQPVAEFGDLQQQAFDMTSQGLGSFQPFMNLSQDYLLGNNVKKKNCNFRNFYTINFNSICFCYIK